MAKDEGEIVGAALQVEASKRRTFLDQVCFEGAELQAEIESLLTAHADADRWSEHRWTLAVAEAPGLSESVGPYRLLREPGVGGMGQVWLANPASKVARVTDPGLKHRRPAAEGDALIILGRRDEAIAKHREAATQKLKPWESSSMEEQALRVADLCRPDGPYLHELAIVYEGKP